MKTSLVFLRQFLLHPKETGAVAPSSSALAETITEAANLGAAKCVVEIGPGTGVFTERILKKIPADCIFFAIESNPDFVAATKKRCHGARVYERSAVEMQKCLAENGVVACDAVVCGLPWSIFDEQLQEQIMNAIAANISPHGRFVTFAYLQGAWLPSGRSFARLLKKHFVRVSKSKIVWKNLPPAFVYICEQLRKNSAA